MSLSPPSSSALAVQQPRLPGRLDEVALQRLWLATQKREWRSLAVVAAGAEVDTLSVANLLAKISWSYCGQPSAVLDFRELTLRMVEHELRELREHISYGERVIIALSAVSQNPTTLAVAGATDAAVLCMKLGKSQLRAANAAITEIGRQKFLGSIIVRAEKKT